MRIGISVITYEGQNIWANGMGQNVIFLAQLFQKLPFVSSVLLIDVGNQPTLPQQVDAEKLGLRCLRMHEASDGLDLVVEMAGALDPKWLALMRARGKKVVYYCCGQPFVGMAENAVFGKPGYFPSIERCDEIWLLPKDEAFAPMMRTLYRSPVHTAPYIWRPDFLQARIDEIAAHGLKFGYQPRPAAAKQARAGLRVAIFEPNISVVKTSTVSMLVCDEAYRAEPGSVQKMHVLNTLHLKDHPTMLHFANSLDLVREHRAVFHGRNDIAAFMAEHADAVVSHQWCNAQNYSHLDALYGNYPLIHNAPWLADVGYYYPNFDAAAGGQQLRLAHARHDAEYDDYRVRAQRVLSSLDPFNAANLGGYADRLLNLWRGQALPAQGATV